MPRQSPQVSVNSKRPRRKLNIGKKKILMEMNEDSYRGYRRESSRSLLKSRRHEFGLIEKPKVFCNAKVQTDDKVFVEYVSERFGIDVKGDAENKRKRRRVRPRGDEGKKSGVIGLNGVGRERDSGSCEKGDLSEFGSRVGRDLNLGSGVSSEIKVDGGEKRSTEDGGESDSGNTEQMRSSPNPQSRPKDVSGSHNLEYSHSVDRENLKKKIQQSPKKSRNSDKKVTKKKKNGKKSHSNDRKKTLVRSPRKGYLSPNPSSGSRKGQVWPKSQFRRTKTTVFGQRKVGWIRDSKSNSRIGFEETGGLGEARDGSGARDMLSSGEKGVGRGRNSIMTLKQSESDFPLSQRLITIDPSLSASLTPSQPEKMDQISQKLEKSQNLTKNEKVEKTKNMPKKQGSIIKVTSPREKGLKRLKKTPKLRFLKHPTEESNQLIPAPSEYSESHQEVLDLCMLANSPAVKSVKAYKQLPSKERRFMFMAKNAKTMLLGRHYEDLNHSILPESCKELESSNEESQKGEKSRKNENEDFGENDGFEGVKEGIEGGDGCRGAFGDFVEGLGSLETSSEDSEKNEKSEVSMSPSIVEVIQEASFNPKNTSAARKDSKKDENGPKMKNQNKPKIQFDINKINQNPSKNPSPDPLIIISMLSSNTDPQKSQKTSPYPTPKNHPKNQNFDQPFPHPGTKTPKTPHKAIQSVDALQKIDWKSISFINKEDLSEDGVSQVVDSVGSFRSVVSRKKLNLTTESLKIPKKIKDRIRFFKKEFLKESKKKDKGRQKGARVGTLEAEIEGNEEQKFKHWMELSEGDYVYREECGGFVDDISAEQGRFEEAGEVFFRNGKSEHFRKKVPFGGN